MRHFIAKIFVLFMMAAASLTMTTTNMETDTQAATSKGQQVVNYAKKYVGNKYKYGGTSLTKGADCSGFTLAVYKKFGKKLPHSSSSLQKDAQSVRCILHEDPFLS